MNGPCIRLFFAYTHSSSERRVLSRCRLSALSARAPQALVSDWQLARRPRCLRRISISSVESCQNENLQVFS